MQNRAGVDTLADNVAAALGDALFLAMQSEGGVTGELRAPSGRMLPADEYPEIVLAALAVLSGDLRAIPLVAERAPQGGLMLAAVSANHELTRLGAAEVPLPADGAQAATAEALRSALVELSARGWPARQPEGGGSRE